MRRQGMTLIEVLVVVSIIAVLAGILLPSLSAVRRLARLGGCLAVMHGVHSAVGAYTGSQGLRMPSFSFSDIKGDLPLSGHWGGADQAADPTCFGRQRMEYVNLWTLIRQGMLTEDKLFCPGASEGLAAGAASYFHYTRRFSTYCLRLPPSQNLFGDSPGLARYYNQGLLDIYRTYQGGQSAPPRGAPSNRQTVPQVRLDGQYELCAEAGGGTYRPSTDALLSDTFWRQDYQAPAPAGAGLRILPVRMTWCHERAFNVLYGDGKARTVYDSGVVAANSLPPGGVPAVPDCTNFAAQAEAVWRFFDQSK